MGLTEQDYISIIVPVYNVKDYLDKCVNSILNQTYKSIDIILVDDGSTDGSQDVCDKYASQDDRVRAIHKVNGGLSSARNEGLKFAKGSFVVFVDSDDYIEPDMMESLYNAYIKYDADIVCCGKYLESSTGTKEVNCESEYCISQESAIKRMLQLNDIDNSACDKLYKLELFDDIEFPEGRYYEDMGTLYRLMGKANKVAHIPFPKYHYITRDGSITKSTFNDKHLDAIYFAGKIIEYMKCNFPACVETAEAFYYLQLTNTMLKIKQSDNYTENKDTYKRLKKEFRHSFSEIIRNKEVAKGKKLVYIFTFFNMYSLVNVGKRMLAGIGMSRYIKTDRV
ncbi:MAG: glycosyltransferase family 2 protein [Eubacterium sp.]